MGDHTSHKDFLGFEQVDGRFQIPGRCAIDS
jgi:hypothetical protein